MHEHGAGELVSRAGVGVFEQGAADAALAMSGQHADAELGHAAAYCHMRDAGQALVVLEYAEHGIAFSAQAVGGMFGIYFSPAVPQSFAEVMQSDKDQFNRFFHAMLGRGVYFAPSAYEAGFVSAAHTPADIAATVAAADATFAQIRMA